MVVLVEVMENAVQRILGTYENLLDAEHELSEIHDEHKDEILGWDDDYVQIEDDYGNIITYQIIETPEENKKTDEKLNTFEIPVVFNHTVNVHRKINIQAKTKEEAIKLLKEKFKKGLICQNDLQYVDEFWELVNYKIINENN